MSGLHSTIPVVDMKDFENTETRPAFVEAVTKAFHEVGFFAVVNTGTDMEALDKGYDAAAEFFAAPMEKKDECNVPDTHGERGYVHSEIAQGQSKKDHKEFYHLGESRNVWPKWMDLENPAMKLLGTVNDTRAKLEVALSLAIGEKESFLSELSNGGTSLMRCIHYPANCTSGVYWAAEHTDIDLFTLLPRSTEEGLQVQHEGEWIDVRVPANAFVINCGDKLQNMTNGYFRSSNHRVVAAKDKSKERYSIVFFIHPKDEDSCNPLKQCVDLTGGVQNYPEGTSKELLHHRLMELGLAERKTGTAFFDRVAKLVEDKKAAPPVQKTFDLWQTIVAEQKL